MQDLEFTVERGQICVCCRPATASAPRARRSAWRWRWPTRVSSQGGGDYAGEPSRVGASPQTYHRPCVRRRVIAKGEPGSPGIASGPIALSAGEAEECARRGDPAVFVLLEAVEPDYPGFSVASGIVTTRGGMTSHAPVIARGKGLPCVTGASEILIEAHAFKVGDRKYRLGNELLSTDPRVVSSLELRQRSCDQFQMKFLPCVMV